MTPKLPTQVELVAKHARDTGHEPMGRIDTGGTWTCGECGERVPVQVLEID